jgi:uncharacterized protein YbjT (DUF2867 family)
VEKDRRCYVSTASTAASISLPPSPLGCRIGIARSRSTFQAPASARPLRHFSFDALADVVVELAAPEGAPILCLIAQFASPNKRQKERRVMILVTGSTGLIGSEVVRLLSRTNAPVRAFVRSPSRQEELPGVTWVSGDLSKPETLPAAFAGCTKLFLLTGNLENAAGLQRNAIAAARQAGVAHVVKLSAFGASPRSKSLIGRSHHQIEQELQESGMAWTMLRPHHFMQNLLGQADNIINDGVVYSSSGDGRIPFIDTRDIAAVAAVSLTQPNHTGQKYVITGSEALSYGQATDILANAIGRPLRFVDEPVDEARARLTKAGQPAWLVDSLLAIAAYQRAGGPTETITTVVADLTGKPPRTFAEFARDYTAAFQRPAAAYSRADT